jgi:hypothetical protein
MVYNITMTIGLGYERDEAPSMAPPRRQPAE